MKARAYLWPVILLVGLILSPIFPMQVVQAANNWVVNSLGDNALGSICTLGDCTLRSAIHSAASGDTITFSVTGLIHLNFGGLTIAKNLTVHGPSSYALTVSGVVDGAPVFTVNSGISLNLSGLSITHGRSFPGAGISNQGNLAIDQCSLYDHYADEDGGALYNDGCHLLTGLQPGISGGSGARASGGRPSLLPAQLWKCGNRCGDERGLPGDG